MGGAVLALVVALTGCGGGAAGTRDGRAATSIVIGSASEPEALNPVLGFAPDGAAKIFDGLVRRAADLTLQPALAARLPRASDDGLVWTVPLRADVVFHDGTPLTADDVVFTYAKVLDERVASPLAGDFAMLEEVVATGEHEVAFHLSTPYAPFAQRLTLGIVPRHAFAGVTDWTGAAFNRKPIGTGPFRFVSWRAGESLVLEANERYWDGPPALERVTVSFTGDDQARAARMASGELDAAELPARLAQRFAADTTVRVQQRPSADYRGVMYPQQHPVTGDLALRRALDLAVDRVAMVAGVLAGAGTPAYGPVAPDVERFYEPAAERRHDVAAAQRVLTDGGWLPGGDGIRARDGRRAAFTLMYPAGDVVRERLALAFAADAKKVGVEVRVDGLSWTAITPRMGTDALLMAWGTPYDPDFITYNMFHSSMAAQGSFNPGSYGDPAVDAALDAGRTQTDPDARAQAYRDLQRAMASNPPWTFLVYVAHVYVVRDAWDGADVEQVEPHDHGLLHGPWWNLEKWTPR